MRFESRTITFALCVAGLIAGTSAVAQTASGSASRSQITAPNPAEKLGVQYSTLAGSSKNALSLVAGLRDGSAITLTGSSAAVPSASFTPATGKLGYGNVNIALALAKADLEKQGISNPTPSQLAAALNGGMISTSNGAVSMAGVLSQRASGLGWGQIANSMGTKIGALVSDSKTDVAGRKTDNPSKASASHELTSQGKSAESHGDSVGSKGGQGASNGAGNGNGNGNGNGGGGGGGGGGGKK
jgi:hypothetical protein